MEVPGGAAEKDSRQRQADGHYESLNRIKLLFKGFFGLRIIHCNLNKKIQTVHKTAKDKERIPTNRKSSRNIKK